MLVSWFQVIDSKVLLVNRLIGGNLAIEATKSISGRSSSAHVKNSEY